MPRVQTGKNLLNSPFLLLLVRVTQLLSDPWSGEIKVLRSISTCLQPIAMDPPSPSTRPYLRLMNLNYIDYRDKRSAYRMFSEFNQPLHTRTYFILLS